MTNRTNKSQLVEVVARRTGMTPARAGDVVDVVLASIDDLASMGPLSLRNFGRFERVTSVERDGRHPLTGAPIRIPETSRLSFRAARPRA